MKKIISRIKLMFHRCEYDTSKAFYVTRKYLPALEYNMCKHKGCDKIKWVKSLLAIALIILSFSCSTEEEEENYCIYQRDSKVITDATQIGQVRYVYAGCSPNKTAKSILSENCTCPTNPGF